MDPYQTSSMEPAVSSFYHSSMRSDPTTPSESFDLPRIRLRRPRMSNAEAVFDYGSDPVVARYMDWPLRTDVDSIRIALSLRPEAWDSGAEFYWVIAMPLEDRAIGAVTCHLEHHAADVGFLVHRSHWGRGYATAAAQAVLDWAFSLASIWRVWASCDTENLASARVLEKIGITREGTLRRADVRPNLSPEPRDAFVYAKVKPYEKKGVFPPFFGQVLSKDSVG